MIGVGVGSLVMVFLSGGSVVGGWDEVSVEVGDFHGVEDDASAAAVDGNADSEVAQCLRVGQADEHE